jgi:catechol 2,3-dioxygenase-like lactoylglutathione lyase family enzyme/ketosteroid isomerase-like protein
MKQLFVGFLGLLCNTMLLAQSNAGFQFTFNHMALSVKDMEASVAFYKKVFQLKEIENRSAREGIRWLSLGEDKELHLISLVKEPVKVNRAVHLAITTASMEAFIKHLQQLGIPFSDWEGTPGKAAPRADGVLQLYLQDPDGYWLEVNNGYASAAATQQIKDEVWKLEEDYWVYVKNKDNASYLKLWHDDFVGYPSTNIIGTKKNITDWMTEMYKSNAGKVFDYVLNRKVENVFGDIVIVLYDATQVWRNEKNEVVSQSTFKLTHTWKKTDKGWLIIGGMGANK